MAHSRTTGSDGARLPVLLRSKLLCGFVAVLFLPSSASAQPDLVCGSTVTFTGAAETFLIGCPANETGSLQFDVRGADGGPTTAGTGGGGGAEISATFAVGPAESISCQDTLTFIVGQTGEAGDNGAGGGGGSGVVLNGASYLVVAGGGGGRDNTAGDSHGGQSGEAGSDGVGTIGTAGTGGMSGAGGASADCAGLVSAHYGGGGGGVGSAGQDSVCAIYDVTYPAHAGAVHGGGGQDNFAGAAGGDCSAGAPVDPLDPTMGQPTYCRAGGWGLGGGGAGSNDAVSGAQPRAGGGGGGYSGGGGASGNGRAGAGGSFVDPNASSQMITPGGQGAGTGRNGEITITCIGSVPVELTSFSIE